MAHLVTFVLQRYWYHASRVGTQARCVLSAAIYQKSLKVNFSNKGTTVGEVVNYMSVDAQVCQHFKLPVNNLSPFSNDFGNKNDPNFSGFKIR